MGAGARQPKRSFGIALAMADSFELGRPDFGLDAGGAPRGRMGVLVAAFLALAASGGLAWWMLSPERPEVAPSPAASLPASAPTPPAAPQPLRFAPDEPDPAQVKTAHADVQAAFVAGGPQVLQRASAACAKAKAKPHPKTKPHATEIGRAHV